MDIAEKVSIKPVSSSRAEKAGILSTPRTLEKTQMTSKVAGEGFEIMANVVWAEIGRAMMEELGGIIFASGRPNEFRNARMHLFFYLQIVAHIIGSTTKPPRHLSVHLNSLLLQYTRSKPCDRIPSIPLLISGGSSLFTSSFDGRKL
jgi:hypothetical protein